MSVTINDFGASGGSHSSGVVPDPGSTAGTSRFLREDSSWAAASPNPNAFYYNLGPQCATLSNFGTSAQRVQLSTGGDALLTLPAGASIDGFIFRVKFVAQVSVEASNNVFGGVYCGAIGGGSTLLTFDVSPGGSPTNVTLASQVYLFWDSGNQDISGFTEALTPGFTNSTTVAQFAMPNTTSSDFFIYAVAGDASGTPNTCTFKLLEFAIQIE